MRAFVSDKFAANEGNTIGIYLTEPSVTEQTAGR